MADNIPWFKAIQSASRGFRPGMEITVLKSRQQGKTITVDFEGDEFRPWRITLWPHYAEYHDFDTGETYWKKFNGQPRSADLYTANNVVRQNDDGTYEYIKNRETGELRQLTEEEIMWMLLHV